MSSCPLLRTWLPASLLAAALLTATVASAEGPEESPEAPAPPEVVVGDPPAPAAIAAPLASPPRHRRQNIPMVVGGTVSATAGAIALLFGGLGFAANGNSEIRVCHEHLGCHTEDVTAEDRAAFQTISWVSLATGAALAGTGVTLILYGLKDRSEGHAEAKGTLRVFATPREAGLRLTF